MVRIIGGQWRSRKLQFSGIPDLRPTPDRVRETLFNWLQPVIVSARCLDVFAGSGALGFEALSRGAAYCLFIDKHPQSIADIQRNLVLLKSDAGDTITGDSLHILQRLQEAPAEKQFNVVFVDPPYALNCALQCCQLLAEHQWLTDEAYIYIESPATIDEKQLPPRWKMHRQQKAGNVHFHLAIKQ
ncbi:MAG: 16S rRNA (guanine(966)-N(2))-methyltransferase RsmD [Gammaproteobacteria bacterium]|nr:16S rRNA (guanine(966)-N(2))-methyltransferase RsmD [Gammaproteobacteria bacterium]